jgi:GT2 family glycosyltransferase
MENNKTIAACQPKVLSYKEKNKFEYAGSGGGWIDHLGYPFARGRVFETIENDSGQYNDITDVFWASGAAMFIRPEVYHQLNGFDGSFFAHQEEIDLCWRIQLAGFKISYCGASEVYHVGGGTLPKGHRKTYLNFRNNLIMLSKNLPIRIKWWLLPYRMLLDGIFAIKCLLAGDTNSFKALLQAHFSVWKYWFSKKPFYALHRKSLVSLHGVSKKSIVWEYFVRKKRLFKEII